MPYILCRYLYVKAPVYGVAAGVAHLVVQAASEAPPRFGGWKRLSIASALHCAGNLGSPLGVGATVVTALRERSWVCSCDCCNTTPCSVQQQARCDAFVCLCWGGEGGLALLGIGAGPGRVQLCAVTPCCHTLLLSLFEVALRHCESPFVTVGGE
jgi:hypothetical protein